MSQNIVERARGTLQATETMPDSWYPKESVKDLAQAVIDFAEALGKMETCSGAMCFEQDCDCDGMLARAVLAKHGVSR